MLVRNPEDDEFAERGRPRVRSPPRAFPQTTISFASIGIVDRPRPRRLPRRRSRRECRAPRLAVHAGAARPAAGTLRRILGVDAALDGVAALREVCLRPRQRLAGGDEQLRAHQIDAGDRFGDRMLDLQPRVHLEEVERARVALAFEQELDRAGVDVAEPRARRRRPRRPCAARTAGVSAGHGLSSITF